MSLVGSYVAFSKPLAAVIPVFLLAWMRFGIGAMAMVRWLKKPPSEPALTPQTKRLLFLESLFGNFLFTLCMMYGVSLTSAVYAGVIMASIPAVVALMSWSFLGERIGWRIWVSIGMGGCGIALLALSGTTVHNGMVASSAPRLTDFQTALGVLLLFGAVLCEAAYSVIGKRLTQAMGPKRITSLINLWGFALSTPMGFEGGAGRTRRCVDRSVAHQCGPGGRSGAGRVPGQGAIHGTCDCAGRRVAGHTAPQGSPLRPPFQVQLCSACAATTIPSSSA